MTSRVHRRRATLCFVLLALFTGAVAWCKDDGYAHSLGNTCLNSENHSSWMASIPSRARLFRDLTLPGTHDSGSYRYYGQYIQRTHCSNIKSQLMAGLRVLDLRLARVWDPHCLPFTTDCRRISVVHGWFDYPGVLTFEEAWDAMTEFLTEHPTEVIVAIVRHEYGTGWDEEMVKERFNRSKYAKFRDTSCLGTDCAIGPSRGKIVYVAKGNDMLFLNALSYYRVVSTTDYQHCEISDTTNPNLEDHYMHVNIRTKWNYVRAALTRASNSDVATHGFITYVSAAASTFPYYFASGRSLPDGRQLQHWRGAKCSEENRDTYYLYYHRDCTCDAEESKRFCMLFHKGLNTLVYEWISNGLAGHKQHPSEAYVFPRHLGIVLLDFPSNGLIRRLIDVNTAAVPSPPPASERFPVCGKKCACMAGDTLVNTGDRGAVAASNLAPGDVIEGTEAESWCRVVSTTHMDRGSVYGEFTEDHLLWHDNGTVLPNGDGGNQTPREADLVNVFTDCPAARTASGTAFTPLSTIFCDNALSGSEYVAMYAALMRIVNTTGAFWFNPLIYRTAFANATASSSSSSSILFPEDEESESGSGTFIAETFSVMLPTICKSLTACAVNGTGCDVFEATAARWMADHLPEEQYDVVKTAYPNLGTEDSVGTLVEDALGLRTSSSSSSASAPQEWLSSSASGGVLQGNPSSDSQLPVQSASSSGERGADAVARGESHGKGVSLAAIIVPAVVGPVLLAAIGYAIFRVCSKRQSHRRSCDSSSHECHEPKYIDLSQSPYCN